MTSLVDLSLKRLAPELPMFPGLTLAQQLAAGRSAAEAALRKYVPNFRFSESDAESVLFDVDAWSQRNGAALAAAIDPDKNPTGSLPAELALRLGADKTQQFVLASFTAAAAGLGPWNAGEVARVATGSGTVIAGTLVDESWARSDASARLDTFRVIVAMDTRGDLGRIFQPQAAAGLGALPVIAWVFIAVTAIVAASIVVYLVATKTLTKNNDLMADLCKEAQRQGRDDIVLECVRATENLQEGWGSQLGKQVAKGILIFGGMFLAVRYVLPLAVERFDKRRRAEA